MKIDLDLFDKAYALEKERNTTSEQNVWGLRPGGGEEGLQSLLLLKVGKFLEEEALRADIRETLRATLRNNERLLFPIEASRADHFFRQAPEDKLREYTLNLLYGTGRQIDRIAEFTTWAHGRKITAGLSAGVNLTAISYLLAIAHPREFAFCKPATYFSAVEALTDSGPDRRSDPRRLIDCTNFYIRILRHLERQAEGAQLNLFDVHSLLWLFAANHVWDGVLNGEPKTPQGTGHYVLYIDPDRAKSGVEAGLDVFYWPDRQFSRIRAGSVLWLVTIDQGQLLLVGRQEIARVVSPATLLLDYGFSEDPSVHTCTVAEEGSQEPMRLLDISNQASSVHFEDSPNPLPEVFSDSDLRPMGAVILSTGALFERLWHGERTSSESTLQRVSTLGAVDQTDVDTPIMQKETTSRMLVQGRENTETKGKRMKRHFHQWTIHATVRRGRKINPKPAYQRGPVWTTKQRQLLMDSIARDLDIPKFYLRQMDEGDYEYEVVDGQQRLRAIWDFVGGKYPLAKDADPVNGEAIANKKYEDLTEDLKDEYDAYELSIVILQNADMDDVEEMFLRLQNGTSLNAAEKRNAMPGNMKHFVRELAEHSFFNRVQFTNKRYAYHQIIAQMMLLELSGEFCNVKNSDLEKMYRRSVDFDTNCPKAKKVRRTLDFLAKAFPSSTPEMKKKYQVVSLYLLASRFLEQYAIKGREGSFAKAFIEFEAKRREAEELPEDQRDPRMITYQEKTSHATDSHDSLRYRHEILSECFLLAFPDLKRLDNQRLFTHEQKVAIWRRDECICQGGIKCDGMKCEWEEWEADHIVPWSKGGATTVENGQVLCVACNRSKSDSGTISS